MIEQYDEIVSKYDIHMNGGHKGRGTIILNTKEGPKLLKEVKLHEEKINFIYEIKNELAGKGFHVDKIIKSKEDGLYVEYDDKKYVLTDWSSGREIYLNDQNEVSLAITNLARIHQATVIDKSSIKYNPYDKTGKLLERLVKHNQELVRIKNNIRRKPKWSEFDILFLDAFHGYYYEALQATREIESYYYKTIEGKYLTKRCLNHGQYNQHNLLIDSSRKLFTVNFEYAAYDIPVVELYSMLRKVLEKNDWHIRMGMDAVEAYMKVYDMDIYELNMLRCLFMYPEKYWKISNFYASLNKAWKPKQSIVKLKKLLKQESRKKAYIRYLTSYINK